MKKYFTKIAIGIVITLFALSAWQLMVLRRNLLEKIETLDMMISKYEAKAQFVHDYLPIVTEYTKSEITAKRILAAVYENSLQYDLPADLILAVIKVESEFNPRAYSRAGAIGLMQVMPITGTYVGRSLGILITDNDDLYDIERNIQIGVVFLKDCIERLGEERGLGYYYAGRYTQHYHRYTKKIAAAQELWADEPINLAVNM